MDVSKLRKHVQIHSRSHSRDEMPAALRRQESQRSRISLGPPTSLFNLSQKKKRPPGNKKQQITVSQTCRFLESNDYPVSFANHSSEFLADLPPSPTSTCLWWPHQPRKEQVRVGDPGARQVAWTRLQIHGNLGQAWTIQGNLGGWGTSSCSSSSLCILYKTKKKQNQTEHLQKILLPSTHVYRDFQT